jgi:hypothetical protein
MRATWLVLLTVVGCANGNNTLPEVQSGRVVICLGGPEVVRGADESFDVTFSGTVTSEWASDYALTGCSDYTARTAQITDENGNVWSLGYTLFDEDGGALDTPSLSWMNRVVEVTYRYRKPWGDVSGFTMTDRDGLVAAGDEGTWGGALLDGDVEGLTVRAEDEVIAKSETECSPQVGYALTFEAQTDLNLVAVSSAPLTVNDKRMTAYAIAAHEDEDKDACLGQETTGVYGWAITR